MNFGLITGALGLLNGLGQNSAGRSTMRQGQDLIGAGVGTATQAYNRLKQYINDQEAQGAYKAEEMLQLAQEKNQLALTNSLKNASAQMALLGYKPGDSKQNEVLNRKTQSAQLANTQQQYDIQNAYDQKRMNAEGALSNAAMGLSGVQRSAGGQLYDMGSRQVAGSGVGSSLGLISQFLTPSNSSLPNSPIAPGVQPFNGSGNDPFLRLTNLKANK